jgi:PAS domain S-box-containing protein
MCQNDLERQIAELCASRQMLRNVTENFPGLVFWKDRNSVYLGCNRAFAQAAGLRDSSEIVGKTDLDLPWAQHEAAAYRDADRDVIESGVAKLGIVESQLQADGRLAWFETTKAPLLDAEGKVIGVLGTSNDISERRRAMDAVDEARAELERRVNERTRELVQANKELESFASAVSHDLRAPLRGIDMWSQALLERCKGQLDEASIHYLESIRTRSHRMRQLIESLLRLSLVGKGALHLESVDLSLMAREIAQMYEAMDRKVDLFIEPGLTVQGDAALLRAALLNLLGNAWKFTGKVANPKIEFGANRTNGKTVFFIRDNGAGFTAFHRLHHASEFPGSGIGLATVQRIIQRHGGRIWAESISNGGATFFFTLRNS